MNASAPYILGVSYSHNGAACLLRGDEIQVMVQEERLTGVKRAVLPHYQESLAVRYCLDHAGIGMDDLDLVVACHFSGAGPPAVSPTSAHRPQPRGYLTLPHHLGHAYGAFATSAFAAAAVLVIDGQGGLWAHLPEAERALAARRRGVVPGQRRESEVVSLYRAGPDGLTLLEKHTGDFIPAFEPGLPRQAWRSLQQFGSLGGMYSAVAGLIFGDPMEAGKVMGLVPYGRPTLPPDRFYTFGEDGCFRYADVLPPRYRDLLPWPENQVLFADLAASVQAALEEAVSALAARALALAGEGRLCYAGGVALNGIANEQLFARYGGERLFIMPAAEDSGPAIGAAYYGLKALTGRLTGRRLVHDCLGRPYPPAEVDRAIAGTPGVAVQACADPLDEAVERLCRGEVVGWFSGGSELGPRALGQRSILCDPRLPDGRERLNEQVKHREGFRPFAPAVLAEEAAAWFVLPRGARRSPAMLRVCRFQPGRADHVPAAAHIDETGRLQTVTEAENGPFYRLIKRFALRTGVPMLVNTSFNVAGEPIVESPADALWCLLCTQIDCLVLEGRVVVRRPELRSVLDLYPRLAAHRLRLEVPIRAGDLALRIGADAEASLCARTPYGEVTRAVPATDVALFRLCDGTRDGWGVLEALRRSRPDCGEAFLVRRLCYYRRGSLLTFGDRPRDPAQGEPP